VIRRFVREHEDPPDYLRRMLGEVPRLGELFPLLRTDTNFTVKQLWEPIKPTWTEVEKNSRSRSSAVHVLQKGPRSGLRLPEKDCDACRSIEQRFRKPEQVLPFQGAPAEQAEEVAHAVAAVFNSDRSPANVGAVPATGSSTTGLWEDEETATIEPAETTVSAPSDTGGTEEPGRAHNEVPQQLFEAVAISDYNADAVVDGYATLRKGDKVKVFYEGSSGEELGWFYGHSVAGQKLGWFPNNAIDGLNRLGMPP